MTEETAQEPIVETPLTSEPVIEAPPIPEPQSEPTAQPVEPLSQEPIPEPQMASEPLPEPSTTPIEPISTLEPTQPPQTPPEPILEPVPIPSTDLGQATATPTSEPTPVLQPQVSTPPVIQTSLARELLIKAREVIQFRKRKKLEKIMAMFLKQASITNDDVQKLLYVSDATATRYLDQLEKEGKIRRQGVPGHASYFRI